MNEIPIGSESYRKRNPHLFGAMGAVENPKRKPSQRGEGENRKSDCCDSGLAFRVCIISCRRRLVDEHDNLRTGAKPLVDAIAKTLGFADDADPRLHWEYAQVLTTGQQGVIVKIETRARQ